jgi:hypothetical protein
MLTDLINGQELGEVIVFDPDWEWHDEPTSIEDADTTPLTIEQLYHACQKYMAKGLGSKKILISGDDEGNSFHELFYGFSKFSYEDIAYGLPTLLSREQFEGDNYIVLG